MSIEKSVKICSDFCVRGGARRSGEDSENE